MDIALIIAVIIGILFKLYDVVYGIDWLTDKNNTGREKIQTLIIFVIIILLILLIANFQYVLRLFS